MSRVDTPMRIFLTVMIVMFVISNRKEWSENSRNREKRQAPSKTSESRGTLRAFPASNRQSSARYKYSFNSGTRKIVACWLVFLLIGISGELLKTQLENNKEIPKVNTTINNRTVMPYVPPYGYGITEKSLDEDEYSRTRDYLIQNYPFGSDVYDPNSISNVPNLYVGGSGDLAPFVSPNQINTKPQANSCLYAICTDRYGNDANPSDGYGSNDYYDDSEGYCEGDCYDMDNDGKTSNDFDADGDGLYESP